MEGTENPDEVVMEQEITLRWCVEGSFQPSFFTPPPANEEDSKEDNSVPSVKLQLNFETPKGESSSLGTISSHGDGEECHLLQTFSMTLDQTISVDEGLVRQWVGNRCTLPIHLKATVQGDQAEPKDVDIELKFDGSYLLVGDTTITQEWPDDLREMPEELAFLQTLAVSIKTCKVEESGSEEPKKELVEATLMTPSLMNLLNPLVVHVAKAESLPDAPATKEMLDGRTFPITLKYQITQQCPTIAHEGRGTQWESKELDEPSNPVNIRNCVFGVSDVYLVSDLTSEHLLNKASNQQLEFEVHDRTAIPEDEGLVAQSRTSSLESNAQADGNAADEKVEDNNEGYVCGSASVSLIDLFRGSTRMDVHATILPKSTIRGAASLQWQSRPGRYLQVHSSLSLTIRLSVPLTKMEVSQASPAPAFGRCVFAFDLRDNDLFHAIEDVVRHQNALALGLIEEPTHISDNKGNDTEGAPSSSSSERLRSKMEHNLSMHTVQSLSTTKLTEEQASSVEIDLLTGFHVISGMERIIVVEGIADKGMKRIEEVAHAALQAHSVPKGTAPGIKRRKALFNSAIRYTSRLYTSLGVNLWIVKLRMSIEDILSTGHTFAGVNAASQDCISGLRLLKDLKSIEWSRQAHDWFKFPAVDMMHSIDKKFGGRLTKEEVLGTSAATSSSKSNTENAQEHLENQEQRQKGFQDPLFTRKKWKEPLAMSNPDFESTKRLADSQRLSRKFIAENIEYIHLLEEKSKPIKEKWLTWNRDPNALVYLLNSTDSNEKILVKRQLCDIPGRISQEESLARGWYPHGREFQWPCPRDPKTYNQHHKHPSSARVQELHEPWMEGEAHQPLALREKPAHCVDFILHFNSNGLFEESVTSVHLCGDGLERERQAALTAAIEEWESKVVVTDTIFRTLGTTRNHVSQLDKKESLLKGETKKHALLANHLVPDPMSMYTELPFQEPVSNIVRQAEPLQFTGGQNFKNCIGKDKQDIHKIGLDSSWRGGLKDDFQ